MDWANERYVRIYTRNTADLLAVGWEGRVVWYEILRAADRSGVIDTGGDMGVMPEMLRVPPDVFELGFARIVARGMVEVHERALVIPNFEDAQETPQSDAQRQREARARRRDRARTRPETSQNVTTPSRDVTEPSRAVTPSHAVSLRAVPCLTVPSCTGGSSSRAKRPTPTPPPPEAVDLARRFVGLVAKRLPDSAPAQDPDATANRWAVDIDKLHRLNRRDWPRIGEVLDWSQADPFWQANILSGKKLREKFDQLEAQMQRKPVAVHTPGGYSAQQIWEVAQALRAEESE